MEELQKRLDQNFWVFEKPKERTLFLTKDLVQSVGKLYCANLISESTTIKLMQHMKQHYILR